MSSIKLNVQADDKIKEFPGLPNGIKCVVFDCDGVLVDAISSWRTLHDYFGTDNSENLRRFIAGEFHNFLDLIPSDSNPLVNKRWELIQHIRKTHSLVFGIETLQGGNPLNYGSPVEESEVGQCHFTPLFARHDYGIEEQRV